jgi:phosphohistidine phosphatase SixA
MKLFILRHGATTDPPEDADRILTKKGIEEVEVVVRLKNDDLSTVGKMYSSPMQRVSQTLEVAAKTLHFKDETIESQDLMTGSRLSEIINFVNAIDFNGGDILLSSHQSCTSILVLWLTGEDILIPIGSLLAIEVEKPMQGAGKVLWQQTQENSEIKRTVHFVDQF